MAGARRRGQAFDHSSCLLKILLIVMTLAGAGSGQHVCVFVCLGGGGLRVAL